jgi:hypothetical protein
MSFYSQEGSSSFYGILTPCSDTLCEVLTSRERP